MALLGMQNTVSEIYLDLLKVFSSYFNGCQNITISVSRKKYKLVENSIWNNNGFSISEKSKMIVVFNKFILFFVKQELRYFGKCPCQDFADGITYMII